MDLHVNLLQLLEMNTAKVIIKNQKEDNKA